MADPSVQALPGAKPGLSSTTVGGLLWLFLNKAGEHHTGLTILDRPAKIQYTWMSLHTCDLESLVTVTFSHRRRHLLTLRHGPAG